LKKKISIVGRPIKKFGQLVPAVSIYAGANFAMKNNPYYFSANPDISQDHADYSIPLG
jgi:hypothetical protein